MTTKFDPNDMVYFTYHGKVYRGKVSSIKIFGNGSEEYSLYNDEKGYFDTFDPYATEQEAKESLYTYTKENFLKLVDEVEGCRDALAGVNALELVGADKGYYEVALCRIASINDLLEAIKKE